MRLSYNPNSPLNVARQAQDMANESGCKAFQTVAMVSMGAMALAAVTQAMHTIFRELRGRQDNRGRQL